MRAPPPTSAAEPRNCWAKSFRTMRRDMPYSGSGQRSARTTALFAGAEAR
jgi:hypothetical protein